MWKNTKNSIIIPSSFVVGGIMYSVDFVENSEKDLDGALGDYSGILHQIRIANKCRVDEDILDIPEEEKIKTFLHELGHCFGYYYNDDLSESFANAFSHFMYEYLISRK